MKPTCDFCGASDDVKPTIVEVRPEYRADPKAPYESHLLCRDHLACRERVEAIGDEWAVMAPSERVRL